MSLFLYALLFLLTQRLVTSGECKKADSIGSRLFEMGYDSGLVC